MSELAARAGQLLAKCRERGVKLAVAESCTAGRLATQLADAPGAGESFHGGFVVYSKEQKSSVLGVAAALIAEHTAVSQQVAEAMASGIFDRCPADLGVSVTGVAGPDPDEDGNPVGLMHVAVARRSGQRVSLVQRYADKEREQLLTRVMTAALALAIEALDKDSGDGWNE
jgi:nicotinamide-nucleotide amidase